MAAEAGHPSDGLYELLPVVYRERDAERGFPLRALLRIIGAQADVVERDIGQLWDDLFIETCRPWVIPYIGDLVGNRLLFDSSRQPEQGTAEARFDDLAGPDLKAPIAVRTRADVAKTIYYRRRKGTLPMLEELARDVTGWPAHAVEFFELLGWTQHLEHLRFRSRWADVRSVDRMNRVDGPFDELSHTVDVRRIAQTEGWHNIRNIGFFLFRLGSYELGPVPAREASESWRYHFSPLGNPAPLFSRWRREGDEVGLATELHVPAPIRHAFFYEDLKRYRELSPPPDRPDFTDLYGLSEDIGAVPPFGVSNDASLFILRNGEPVGPTQNPGAPPEVFAPQIVCHQLEPWPAVQPSGRIIQVDPQTGRIAIGDGWPGATDRIDVYYQYGFPAELGGGPYERHKWLLRSGIASAHFFVREGAGPGGGIFPSLVEALQAWVAAGRPDTLITMLDSRTYTVPAQITLPNEGFLVIEAASGERPLLQTNAAGLEIDTLPPADPAVPTREAALTLSGVVVEGHLHVIGDLRRLRLLHSTLVPGRRLTEEGNPALTAASLAVDPGAPGGEINTELQVELAFSISGALAVPEHASGVWLLDSVVDSLDPAGLAYGSAAGNAGPDLWLERTTVLGEIEARSLEMSESIATGRIAAVRTQEGCVRFSYVRPGSHTPRRYRCQPDLEIERAIDAAQERDPALPLVEQQRIRGFIEGWLVPSFVTDRYGQPPYAQLRLNAPREILTGAEDGSEMGVYSHIKQPQRLDNLRLRLDEYLAFGLDAGAIFAT